MGYWKFYKAFGLERLWGAAQKTVRVAGIPVQCRTECLPERKKERKKESLKPHCHL
jgi:hypothetical protein